MTDHQHDGDGPQDEHDDPALLWAMLEGQDVGEDRGAHDLRTGEHQALFNLDQILEEVDRPDPQSGARTPTSFPPNSNRQVRSRPVGPTVDQDVSAQVSRSWALPMLGIGGFIALCVGALVVAMLLARPNTDDAGSEQTSAGEQTTASNSDAQTETAPAPPSTAVVPNRPATLSMIRTPGAMLIDGELPSGPAGEGLRDAVSNITAGQVTDQISLADDVMSPEWLTTAEAVLPKLDALVNGIIEFSDAGLAVSGEVEPGTDVAALTAAVEAASGSPVSMDVFPTELAPAAFELSLADGVLTIGGTLPSEVDAMALATEAERLGFTVDNRSEVDAETYLPSWLDRIAWLTDLARFEWFAVRYDGGLQSVISGGDSLSNDSMTADADLVSVLDHMVGVVESAPESSILIVGHSDSSGTQSEQHDLTHQWTDLVAAYFVESGIPADRIQTAGRSGSAPIFDNGTERGRRLNRRIEILVSS